MAGMKNTDALKAKLASKIENNQQEQASHQITLSVEEYERLKNVAQESQHYKVLEIVKSRVEKKSTVSFTVHKNVIEAMERARLSNEQLNKSEFFEYVLAEYLLSNGYM
jgi:hypothetical protein